MQDTKILYSLEQIEVPDTLGEVLKKYTKNVILSGVNGDNLLKWSANFFAKQTSKETPYEVKKDTYEIKPNVTMPLFNEKDLKPVPTSTTSVKLVKNIDFRKIAKSIVSGYVELPPLIITGPSGVGKSSIIYELIRRFPDVFKLPVFYTTRKIRIGEVEGKDFFFVDKEKFTEGIEKNEFYDWSKHGEDFFGVKKSSVDYVVGEGKACVLDIDLKRCEEMLKGKVLMDAFWFFVRPPDMEEMEKRLRGGSEKIEEEVLKLKLENISKQLKVSEKFEFIIENDLIESAAQRIFSFYQKENESLKNEEPNVMTPRSPRD